MVWNQIKITRNLKSVFVRLRSQLFAVYNSGHTATLRSAQIRQSRTSYVCRTLYEMAPFRNIWSTENGKKNIKK